MGACFIELLRRWFKSGSPKNFVRVIVWQYVTLDDFKKHALFLLRRLYTVNLNHFNKERFSKVYSKN